ncbi:MAG: hypothetical protein Q9184_003021 [Pyrenodesmia sp. 2 TL-2023]
MTAVAQGRGMGSYFHCRMTSPFDDYQEPQPETWYAEATQTRNLSLYVPNAPGWTFAPIQPIITREIDPNEFLLDKVPDWVQYWPLICAKAADLCSCDQTEFDLFFGRVRSQGDPHTRYRVYLVRNDRAVGGWSSTLGMGEAFRAAYSDLGVRLIMRWVRRV